MITDQQPIAALFVTTGGKLFISTDETDSRLRRRRLVVEVSDLDVIARISAHEANLVARQRHMDGDR